MQTSTVRDLVETYYDCQKVRIATAHRIRTRADAQFTEAAENIIKSLKDLEDGIKPTKTRTGKLGLVDYMENQIIRYPISKWITSQKGLSTVLAAGLISYIHPIDRFSNVGKLWAYAGYDVVNVCQNKGCGKRHIQPDRKTAYIENMAARLQMQHEKKKNKTNGDTPDFIAKASKMVCQCDNPVLKQKANGKMKGSLIDYNPRLKTLVWKCSAQFMKQGDMYKDIYTESKASYVEREGVTVPHATAMAQRKTAKVFLSHLWLIWRELEGLPVTKPYIIDIGKHSDYIAPPGPSVADILAERDV